jgi:hypothetical protein
MGKIILHPTLHVGDSSRLSPCPWGLQGKLPIWNTHGRVGVPSQPLNFPYQKVRSSRIHLSIVLGTSGCPLSKPIPRLHCFSIKNSHSLVRHSYKYYLCSMCWKCGMFLQWGIITTMFYMLLYSRAYIYPFLGF